MGAFHTKAGTAGTLMHIPSAAVSVSADHLQLHAHKRTGTTSKTIIITHDPKVKYAIQTAIKPMLWA